MELIIVLAVGFMNIACFLLGAKVGQKVVKGEPVLSIVNPIKATAQKQENESERNRYNVILANIENYDGTARGQEDVPRR